MSITRALLVPVFLLATLLATASCGLRQLTDEQIYYAWQPSLLQEWCSRTRWQTIHINAQGSTGDKYLDKIRAELFAREPTHDDAMLDAARHGRIRLGMSTNLVALAWGGPWHTDSTVTPEARYDTWFWDLSGYEYRRTATFRDRRLVYWTIRP